MSGGAGVQVAPAGTAGHGALWHDVLARLLEVPELPSVTERVQEVLFDAVADAETAARWIGQDPDLARGILAVARRWPGAPAGLASLPRAIEVLGRMEVQKLTLAIPIHRIVRTWHPSPNIDLPRLWRHSLAVATCAEYLSRTLATGNALEAFSAGLLHDLGKAIIDRCVGPRFEAATGPGGWSALRTWERAVIGSTHAEIGAVLATRWRMVPEVAEAIRLHHATGRMAGGPATRWTRAILVTADRLAHLFGVHGVAGDPRPSSSELSWIHVGTVAHRIRNALERTAEVFAFD